MISRLRSLNLWQLTCIRPPAFIDWIPQTNDPHCVRSVLIRSCSAPHFPAFRLNMERYGVSLRIQSEYGKMRTRITPNTDTFYAVRTNENSLAQGRNFWRLLYSKVLIFSYYKALIKQLLTYCHIKTPPS